MTDNISPRTEAIGYYRTDGPIIKGEEEQKSMATLLKRTEITRFAPNFSNMPFMVIERGFPEKYAKKNCPKMVIFVHSDF